jgi:MOSC domain-containing protein YiiM
MRGEVIGIYVAAKAKELPHPVQCARVIPGHGLDGDRYAKGIGTFSNHKGQRDVSLIESEAITAFERESGISLTAAQIRRNVVTRGVRLNDLVGKEFQVGAIRMRGLRLCEPCTHLVRLTHPATLRGLVHRGGLYAAVLNEGEIAVGDSIDGFGQSP